MEGQWDRQRTPLRRAGRRELWMLAAIAVVLVLAAGAGLYAVLASRGSEPRAGCVEVTAASTTGGAAVRACGAEARRLCREQTTATSGYARAVRTACRRASIAAR